MQASNRPRDTHLVEVSNSADKNSPTKDVSKDADLTKDKTDKDAADPNKDKVVADPNKDKPAKDTNPDKDKPNKDGRRNCQAGGSDGTTSGTE